MQQDAIVLHAVAGSQVAMDVLEAGQVSHSFSHLDAKLHQLTHSRTLKTCQQARSRNYHTADNLAVYNFHYLSIRLHIYLIIYLIIYLAKNLSIYYLDVYTRPSDKHTSPKYNAI